MGAVVLRVFLIIELIDYIIKGPEFITTALLICIKNYDT